jgi:hypothetical protein
MYLSGSFPLNTFFIEVVSKPQIRFKGKASGRSRKRSPAAGGMSKYIYRRSATQPLDLRWGFEATSINFLLI